MFAPELSNHYVLYIIIRNLLGLIASLKLEFFFRLDFLDSPHPSSKYDTHDQLREDCCLCELSSIGLMHDMACMIIMNFLIQNNVESMFNTVIANTIIHLYNRTKSI